MHLLRLARLPGVPALHRYWRQKKRAHWAMIDAAPTSESWGKAVTSIVPERRKGRIQSSPSHRVPYGYLVSNESSPGRSQRSSAHSGQIAILIHYYVVESDLADYFLLRVRTIIKKIVFGDLMCGFEKVQVLSAPRTILATETHTSTILVAVFLEKKVASSTNSFS